MVGDYVKLATDLSDARRSMDEVRGRAESDDGLVEVVVDCSGAVVQLELDPRIYRNPDSTALADLIKDTIGVAIKDATRRAFAVMRKSLPADAKEESADLMLDPILQQLALHDERSGQWGR